MPSAKRPVLDGTMLRQRLAALRRRLRLVAAVRGSGLLLTVLLATAVVAGLLDWRWHLPALVRAVVLVGTLVGGILVAYRYLFRPLSAPSDDLSLALRVEEEYPSLNDALASTVQFLERGTQAESSSAVLEREAVKHALGRAAGCDFAKVVNKRGLAWAGVSGGVFTALTLMLIVFAPSLVATAFLRLANPFGVIEWPKKTQLEIEEPRSRIGRNEAFEVRGSVHGVIPPQAVVIFRFEGFPNLEHHCDIVTDESGAGRLHTSLPAGRVERNFRFQVKANDAVSAEYAVEVLPPPSLIALDSKPSPQLQLFYPAYTGLPSPETLSPGMGNIDAVVGTAVRLRARADRPLRRAWIEYQPEEPSAVVGDLLALFGGARPWWEPTPAKFADDLCTFAINFTPTVNGMYALHFEDETGLHNSRLFELRLHPDPAPAVHLEHPSPARDILSVLPTAELPLEVRIEDLQYAVRSVYLEYRTGRDEQSRRLYLYDPAAGPAPLLAPWAGPAVLAAPTLATRPQRLDFQQILSLKSIRHPDGSGLKEYDVLLLRACADDYDDVNPNKEQGHSPEIEINIVGPSALEIVHNQEQAAIQQALLRLREKQREALQKVTAVENRLKKGEKLSSDDQEKLLQAEKTQQDIRESVGTEKEGLRSNVKRILESLKQNGMEKSAAGERMKDVGRELQRLADNELQQIEPRLTTARRLAELLEEKAREEHRAALEARAKEADKEANAADKSASDRKREAAEAENKAKQSDSEADKTRQLQEAKRQRERAGELRQRTNELRQQAERDRRDAKQAPDPVLPRKTLAEARKAQEEVEKTLNDLLTRRLEPWASSHEIKGEANRLLEEQKRLQAEVEKLQKENTTGQSPDKLTQAQQAELDNLKDTQQKLEERTRQLLEKMDRVAGQREKKDPETARELRDALQEAQQDNITDKMREARENIKQNKLNDAQGKQKESVRDLKKLVKNLEDRREAELDRLAKKLREKEKELGDLVKEQEELRKNVQEAGKIGDKAKREEELKRLARRQKELQKKTNDMVEQLTRMRASRAGEALSQAGEQMDDAGQQMDRGKEGEDEQEETLERLHEAQRELQRARKEAEDELGREQIIRLADLIRPLKERQEALSAETTRFQENVQLKGEWSRNLRSDFLRKRDAQKGLGEETEDVAEKRLSKAPVFARMMRRAGESMTAASERMATVAKDQVDPKELPDAEIAQLQQLAQRRLTQVVDALKEAAEKMEQTRERGGDEAGEEGGDNAAKSSPPSDGIPPLAQLKLLRDLQKDVNERTEAFKKQHHDPKSLPKKARAMLESIRKDQQDVAELIDELNRPAGEAGDAEGDKK
ncbi:MAG TPA: hypothetical protein VMF69_07015 [Gemmataceae bacterium]|nr:hypothetical protein [Gemmataceae bacterium]